jgi:hypothetical protein
MKTPFGCVAVATIGGRRVLPDHEFRRYESGALKVWMLDPEDPEKTSLLATCRIVGKWPQPKRVIEQAKAQFMAQVKSQLST